jgi:3,4-dihydroxy 2-butanone 4-phosphate synthase/GTP cyclohydrolase II
MASSIETLFSAIPSASEEQAHPSITLSYAQSIDGSIALRPDESLLLSGPEAMKMTHRLRATHDAIMVGVNTVIADNPQLTTRYEAGTDARPVVLDTDLRTPCTARLFQHPKQPLLVCAENVPRDREQDLQAVGAEILPSATREDGMIDLTKLMAALWEKEIRNVMVEGGTSVIGSILEERLADFMVLTIAPYLVGGVRAVAQPHDPPILMAEPHWIQLGDDLVLWGVISRSGR